MAKTEQGEINVYIDKNSILHIEYVRIPTDKEESYYLIKNVKKEIEDIVKKTHLVKVGTLVDTNARYWSRRVFTSRERKLAADIARMNELGDIAVVGKSMIMKVSTRFIGAVIGKELKWFQDKDKAYRWLLSHR